MFARLPALLLPLLALLTGCSSASTPDHTTPPLPTASPTSSPEAAPPPPAASGNLVFSSDACSTDADCAPAGCCHAAACVGRAKAPACGDIMCTMECRSGTLDCGGGCLCKDGRCAARLSDVAVQ